MLQVDLSKPPDEDIADDRPVSVRDALVFLELANFETELSVPGASGNSIIFLAHLSRRLIGELIVYPCSGVRPSSVRRRPQFQRSSSLKPLGRLFSYYTYTIYR